MNKLYVRLTNGVIDKGELVPFDEVFDNVKDNNRDMYSSLYYYNEDQYKLFQKTKTVKGIKDVITDKLWWDFDSKDLEISRSNALTLINRLIKSGVPENTIEIYFSGNKGFNVIVKLDRYLTPDLVMQLCDKYAKEIKYDTSMYDAAQILRVPGTRHQESGLFKIPLTYNEFKNSSIEAIKDKASSLDNITEDFEWPYASLPQEFFNVPKIEAKEKTPQIRELDLTKKAHGWKDYKWALAQGFFEAGERHEALIRIAATCRGLGYDKEQTYYFCKSALKKQAERTGQEEFPKEELWENIIEQSVFSDNWEGGQYSYKNDQWLRNYCERMGLIPEKEEEIKFETIEQIGNNFSDYALNFEKNIVKTGIKQIDDNVIFLCSTHNGLLGQPGSGKTSTVLQWSENISKDNNGLVAFYSLDMARPLIYGKMLQRELGCDFKTAIDIYKTDPKRALELKEKIKQRHANTSFNFTSGLTVNDMRYQIKELEQTSGKKVRLLITDYLECIAGPYSDATANTGIISNQMKDLANELNVCSVMLLQTQKHSTSDVSDPLLSMKQVKGSSVIEQSSSVILTMWREGYNPKTIEQDKFISFAAVKNRFGSLWSDDFMWEGKRGLISSITSEQREQLEELKKLKKEMKQKELEENSGW